MTNEEYISILTYNNKNLLLDGKDLIKGANMHKQSVKGFTKLIEYLLLKGNFNNYQIIKTETHKDNTKKISFELKVKPEDFEQLREFIFNFAYICCSNVVENRETNYWAAREWNLKDLYPKINELWQEGTFHAIIPTRYHNEYSIRLSFENANIEDYQNQYKKFLTKEKVKTKKLTK